VKFWRLFADLAVDLSLTLELASPLLCSSLGEPAALSKAECFTCSLVAANILRAMCGVAAGATRAVVTSHFAKSNNTADVQAKEGSQETMVTLLGMVLGLKLAGFAAEHNTLVWAVFCGLTVLHLAANFFAVSALRLNTLNQNRISVVLQLVAQGGDLSVDNVNAREKILPRFGCASGPVFSLGGSVAAFPDRAHLLEKLQSQPCVVLPGSSPHGEIVLALRGDATERECLAHLIAATRLKNLSDADPATILQNKELIESLEITKKTSTEI
jgi:hypothetical protein